jgi:hypothetical protein
MGSDVRTLKKRGRPGGAEGIDVNVNTTKKAPNSRTPTTIVRDIRTLKKKETRKSGSVPTHGVLHPHERCINAATKGAIPRRKMEFLEAVTRARPASNRLNDYKIGDGAVCCSRTSANRVMAKFAEFAFHVLR